MKAVRLHTYDQPLRIDEVPEPSITSPHDVIVRVAGAGLCRTDLHIQQGWFAPLGLGISRSPSATRTPGGSMRWVPPWRTSRWGTP
jgi:threonine dehydrogenase-like Zn-dependent dehydrogenase